MFGNLIILMDGSNRKEYLVAILGLIGAILGGILAYYGSYTLWQEQQISEEHNVAQAMYIDILEISDRFNSSLVYLDLSTTDKRKSGDMSSYIFYDPIPYYSNNGLYFTYSKEISKFDSNLSRDLIEYYTTVMDIEYKRQYINDHYSKTFDYENLTMEEKKRITIYNQNIPAEIVYSQSQANKIKHELNKKYNLNFTLQSSPDVILYIPHNP